MGAPVPTREVSPHFTRLTLASWPSVSGSGAALGADFAANTALTVFGPYTPGIFCTPEKLRFIVANADSVGSGATLSFDLIRTPGGTGTPITLCTLTIAVAAALRGAVLEATIAAGVTGSKLYPTDTLTLKRQATGTVFTTLQGQWEILARQRPQDRGQ